MTIIIPTKLQIRGINFVLIRARDKRPFQQGWQNKIMEFDNHELLAHLEAGGNYGVQGGGEKNLILVDFDDVSVQEKALKILPDTFTVKTGSGMLHLYYFTDNHPESFKGFSEDLETLFDCQAKGKQCVGPGSVHPNGNKYEVLHDHEIAFIQYEKLKELLSSHDQRPVKEKKEVKEFIKVGPKSETYDDKFLDELKRIVTPEKVLNYMGIDTSHNPCACPMHESKAGHCLGFDDVTAHCFHCIHPNQDIFTLNGLKNISEVKVGDITINAKGERVPIVKITKHKFSGNMLSIYVKGNNQPLQITDNHGMYCYKDISCNTNWQSDHHLCKQNCNYRKLKRCNTWKTKNFNISNKINAKQLTINDALFFPIPNIQINKQFIYVANQSNKYRLGPKRIRIKRIPLTKEFLWVIGMYLAEGNTFRGGIKFSLHKEEKDHAKRILSAFKNELNLIGSTFNQTTTTGESLLVRICNSDLSDIFPKLFGSGCENKKVPRELLDLPTEKCKYLLKGILDGDGSTKNGYLGQTSKQLMMDSYELSLKVGYYPSMGLTKTPKEKKQVYNMNPTIKGDGKDKINNHLIMLINKIRKQKYEGDVYDITVDSDHHSLLTPQGIIGNCEGSWNAFTLIKDVEKCSFKAALELMVKIGGMEEEYEDNKKKYLAEMKIKQEKEKDAAANKEKEAAVKRAGPYDAGIANPPDMPPTLDFNGNPIEPLKDIAVSKLIKKWNQPKKQQHMSIKKETITTPTIFNKEEKERNPKIKIKDEENPYK
jgi:intein/homing endonuclease